MRGLFFKIFAIFWIAQSLIFVITTALILSHHPASPQIVFDTLHKSLRLEATQSVNAFETGGCSAFEAYAAARSQTLALDDGENRHVLWRADSVSVGARDESHPWKQHLRSPIRWAVYLEYSGPFDKWRPLYLAAQPAACARDPSLVSGHAVVCVPPTVGRHRSGRKVIPPTRRH